MTSPVDRAAAKQAALAALAALSPFEPVARVTYRSQGRLLIVGEGVRVMQAVEALQGQLSLAVFTTGASVAVDGDVDVQSGQIVALNGFLGAFVLQWRRDADAPVQTSAFDLILDVQSRPAFSMHQPPQGYFHAADSAAFAAAVAALPDLVGEFEKPRFFAYKESICAHGRSRKTGCNRCIDICSTQAIASAGDTVSVDPHLCMGCGACASVCPSGAMRYQYPRVADRGAQLRAMLSAWRQRCPTPPVIVFHTAEQDVAALPDVALPLEVWHAASIGIDVLLGAFVYGAAGVVVAATGREAPEYRGTLEREMRLADSILEAMGYGSGHFAWVAGDAAAAVHAVAELPAVKQIAGFHLTDDKRATVEFAVEHLLRATPSAVESIALERGSPFGAVRVDRDACTMCLACAGACPASALMDGGATAEQPQLRFIERNCVQCGLCVSTCPENALELVPRLLLTDRRKQEAVLNEAEPFYCIACGKSLGTRKLIDKVLGKLAGHAMFQGEGAQKRLQMCADCRVVDMMSNPQEMSVLTGKPVSED